jgi:hypothetical protein
MMQRARRGLRLLHFFGDSWRFLAIAVERCRTLDYWIPSAQSQQKTALVTL